MGPGGLCAKGTAALDDPPPRAGLHRAGAGGAKGAAVSFPGAFLHLEFVAHHGLYLRCAGKGART